MGANHLLRRAASLSWSSRICQIPSILLGDLPEASLRNQYHVPDKFQLQAKASDLSENLFLSHVIKRSYSTVQYSTVHGMKEKDGSRF